MIFHNSTSKTFFQNKKIKLNSRTWMTLKSSVEIFQALEPLKPQWPLQPRQPLWPQWPLLPYFMKILMLLMVGYSLSTKLPIFVLFCGMDHQRTKYSLISPQDFRTTLKQILACIFLSVRPKLLVTFQYEIPCTTQNQEFSLRNGPDHLDWGLHNPSRILVS